MRCRCAPMIHWTSSRDCLVERFRGKSLRGADCAKILGRGKRDSDMQKWASDVLPETKIVERLVVEGSVLHGNIPWKRSRRLVDASKTWSRTREHFCVWTKKTRATNALLHASLMATCQGVAVTIVRPVGVCLLHSVDGFDTTIRNLERDMIRFFLERAHSHQGHGVKQ